MKKIKYMCYSLCAVCMAALCLVSCADEELFPTSQVVEGRPITLSMKMAFNRPADIVVTRSDEFSELDNLTLFVYSSTDDFQQVVSTEDGNLTLAEQGEVVANMGIRYAISFETTSGSKKLLAVANTSDEDGSGTWDNLNTIKQQAINGNLDFEALKASILSLQNTTDGRQPIRITAASQLLMTGWNQGVVFSPGNGDNSNGSITNYGERGIQNQQVVIRLDRSLAHITFNIEADPEGAKGTFTPSSYRVYNIPTNSYLINTSHLPVSGDNVGENFKTFINYASTNVGAVNEGNYSFDFYMPENTCEEIAGVNSYAQRELWTNGTDDQTTLPEDKIWKNAPQTSTFVVISGTYVGETYNGNVTYTVHLGDFSDQNSSSNKWGNYSVIRNSSYTYNMRVLGVDKIVVEAQRESDEGDYQQGAEGNIYDYSKCNYMYSLDAHYEQVYLQYDLSAIAATLTQGLDEEHLDNAIADQLILIIQSEAMDYNHTGTDDTYNVQNKRGTLNPYRIYRNAMRAGQSPQDAKEDVLEGAGNGIYPTKGFDYRWVEFWPQNHNHIALYPGVSDWSKENLSGMENSNAYGGSAQGDKQYLLDVYDVIVAMGNVVKKIYNDESISTSDHGEDGITITRIGNKYYARFTAFVNENYYYKHPLTHADLDTWNVMTNKIPREMIIAMSTDISTDGNNSYSQLHSYISQLSMQTFYNSRQESINAFGIETYNETPLTDAFKWGDPQSTRNLDDSDGRENQLTLIGLNSGYGVQNWSSYIQVVDGEYSSEDYTYNGWTTSTPNDHKLGANAYASSRRAAYAACMSRNRDLNGDGRIDNEEVRWYLPSLNEYIRMSIGTNAVSNEARLYKGDKSKMRGEDYPSAYIADGSLYYTSSADSRRVYWAVERGSYGALDSYYDGSALPVRCIRLLPGIKQGQDLTSLDGITADATYVRSSSQGNIILDFRNRLDESLYRDYVSNDLVSHTEDDDENSFYQGIVVADDFLRQTYTLANIVGVEQQYSYVDGAYVVVESNSRSNPCRRQYGSGWRVPNLVEFSAMNAAGLLDECEDADYQRGLCATRFSNLDVRYGFGRTSIIYCPGANGPSDINLHYKIRCVRDVRTGELGN